MGNHIQRVDDFGVKNNPKSTGYFRPGFYASNASSKSDPDINITPYEKLNPNRARFESMVSPALMVTRVKSMDPRERMPVYRHLFSILFNRMENEIDKREKGFPYSQKVIGGCMAGLELTRRLFREDFPDSEFPV